MRIQGASRFGIRLSRKDLRKRLADRITENGLAVEQQKSIPVYCQGEKVGEYYADLWVENRVICEIKANSALSKENEAQLVNYLAATGIDTGLLINFDSSVLVRRKFREHHESINPEKSC